MYACPAKEGWDKELKQYEQSYVRMSSWWAEDDTIRQKYQKYSRRAETTS